jgi:dUTP pyrophosphatase
MTFLIKCENDEIKKMYIHHSTYHDGDSGLDLFIVKDEIISANTTSLVNLGISCQLKDEVKNKYFGYNMYARSSISKTPLRLANGVGLCDAGYLGLLKAALHNTSNQDYHIKKGERYVQLAKADLSDVSFELVDVLRETSRSNMGFGSTGK